MRAAPADLQKDVSTRVAAPTIELTIKEYDTWASHRRSRNTIHLVKLARDGRGEATANACIKAIPRRKNILHEADCVVQKKKRASISGMALQPICHRIKEHGL